MKEKEEKENKKKKKTEMKEQEQEYGRIVEEAIKITGVPKPELLVDYLILKKKNLLKDYQCLGNVFPKLNNYISQGVAGFLSYIKDCSEQYIYVIPFVFSKELRHDVLALSENNLWRLRDRGVSMQTALERTEYWYLLVNSIRVSLEKKAEKGELPDNNVLDFESLKDMMVKAWEHPTISEKKFVMKKEPARKRKYGYGNNGFGGQRGDGDDMMLQGGGERKVNIFVNDSFEQCIWEPFTVYFMNPYLDLQSGNGNRDRLLIDKLSQKKTESQLVILDF